MKVWKLESKLESKLINPKHVREVFSREAFASSRNSEGRAEMAAEKAPEAGSEDG
jgi:hypothetical protein